MLIAVAVFLLAACIALRYLFAASFVEIGLALFTVLSGTYLAAALLTRKVRTARLRASLQSLFLLLALSQVLLALLIPLHMLHLQMLTVMPLVAGLTILAGLLAGISNVLHFALGGPRANAILLTLSFAALLGALYSILRMLLEAVFS